MTIQDPGLSTFSGVTGVSGENRAVSSVESMGLVVLPTAVFTCALCESGHTPPLVLGK